MHQTKTIEANVRRIQSITYPVLPAVSFLAILLLWNCQREIDLIDLQKQAIAAQTPEEQRKIVNRLEAYYLNLQAPDSLSRKVEAEVDRLLATEVLEADTAAPDTNLYKLEFKLKDLLRDAMIARMRKDEAAGEERMQSVRKLAEKIDRGVNNTYWQKWIAKVDSFDAAAAKNWLQAEQAEKLCVQYYLTDFEKGEIYGSLGLQLLQQAPDQRLRLDIMQRLLVILFQSRGMFDLSFPFAERAIHRANQINYRIRAVGLVYNYAEAFHTAWKNQEALDNFLLALKEAEKMYQLPGMRWYKINATLGTARAQWRLGNYNQALAICQEAEKLELGSSEKISLHNTRGVCLRNLGKYDEAEAEYHKAINYTVSVADTMNRVIVLRNLGTLHFRLTEYEKAKIYFLDAMSLLQKFKPANIEFRCRLLINFAEVAAAQDSINKFNKIMQEARTLIDFINTPAVKGEYLISLGRLNTEIQNFESAYDYFQRANTLYENSGLLRNVIETNAMLIRSLINLSKYQEGKALSNDLYLSAKEIHDAQGQIDAIGLGAYIAYLEGDTEQAIQKSNLLLIKVEELSAQFNNLDNLITFRQKLYPYLKNAVLYELSRGSIDSAFVKLDYLKARETKHRLKENRDKTGLENTAFVNLETLHRQMQDDQLLINYLVTDDTLYAFAVNSKNLILLKKAIKNEKLREMSKSYIDSINTVRNYPDPYRSAGYRENYSAVESMGSILYQLLIDWPELQRDLQTVKRLFIVPDDVLYGLPFSCLVYSGDSSAQYLTNRAAIINLPAAAFFQSGGYNNDRDFYEKKVLISADCQEFPEAVELVNFIKGKFPQAREITVGKSDISAADILSELQEDYDVYFFIGHSIPNFELPDLSYFQLVALRSADQKPFRMDISLKDLKSVNWNSAEMVFLVGCETAIGKLYEGSGFSGFQQVLLTLGAKSVLASLWKIDNRIAFKQVEEFLNNWEKKNAPSIALQEVEKIWIQNLQNDPFYQLPHPFLWKNFTLTQTTMAY